LGKLQVDKIKNVSKIVIPPRRSVMKISKELQIQIQNLKTGDLFRTKGSFGELRLYRIEGEDPLFIGRAHGADFEPVNEVVGEFAGFGLLSEDAIKREQSETRGCVSGWPLIEAVLRRLRPPQVQQISESHLRDL
jgi:hypothetical protein